MLELVKRYWWIPVLVAVLAYGGWRGVGKWQEWREDRARILATSAADRKTAVREKARADSLDRVATTALREGTRQAYRMETLAEVASHLRDSLARLGVAPDTCLPWLRLATLRGDTLESALVAARASITSLAAAQQASAGALAALRSSDSLGWASVDSLTALVGRAPGPCHLLGVPCPELVVGYGVTSSGTSGFVGVGIPVRLFGR